MDSHGHCSLHLISAHIFALQRKTRDNAEVHNNSCLVIWKRIIFALVYCLCIKNNYRSVGSGEQKSNPLPSIQNSFESLSSNCHSLCNAFLTWQCQLNNSIILDTLLTESLALAKRPVWQLAPLSQLLDSCLIPPMYPITWFPQQFKWFTFSVAPCQRLPAGQ